MRSPALPLADDVIVLGDQIGSSPKVEVGEGSPEVGYERLDVGATTARLVQRVFQQHIGRSEFVDHRRVEVLAPKLGEPAPDDGLVVGFLAHSILLLMSCGGSSKALANPARQLDNATRRQTPILVLECENWSSRRERSRVVGGEDQGTCAVDISVFLASLILSRIS